MERPDQNIRERMIQELSSSHWRRVRELNEFMEPDPVVPTLRDPKMRLSRARLLLEETLETIEAMGFHVCLDLHADWGLEFPRPGLQVLDPDLENILFEQTEEGPNLVEIADGLADVSVVTIGAMSRFGIADEPLLQEVDLNNLKKCGLGSRINEHGKLVKPENHPAPDIVGVLKNLGC